MHRVRQPGRVLSKRHQEPLLAADGGCDLQRSRLAKDVFAA
jgi:hypothetical protein